MRCRMFAPRRLSPSLLIAVLAISTSSWAQGTAPESASFQLLGPRVRLALPAGPQMGFRLRDPAYVSVASNDKARWTVPLEKPGRVDAPGKPPWFAPSLGTTPAPAMRADALEHYGQRIPWAGPLILRVRQHAKAHPQLTRVLSFLMPVGN